MEEKVLLITADGSMQIINWRRDYSHEIRVALTFPSDIKWEENSELPRNVGINDRRFQFYSTIPVFREIK